MSDHSGFNPKRDDAPPEAAQGGFGSLQGLHAANLGSLTFGPDAAALARHMRQIALEAAIRTHRPGLDSADHVLQAARKYLGFLEQAQ